MSATRPTNARATPGTVWGVGLGPGDADLMSVRAHRLVSEARHVAFFRKRGNPGQSRRTVDGLLHAQAVEIALDYPVTTEIPLEDPRYAETLAAFYEASVARLLEIADAGRDVVVLCEGDPFFYGSFMHLHARLVGRVPVRVVPGITGMSAVWTATDRPVTWGDDVLTVLSAFLPEDELARRYADSDASVTMKVGRRLARVRRALAAAGRLDDAWLVERASMPEECVRRLVDVPDDATAHYFSIVLLHGEGRRP